MQVYQPSDHCGEVDPVSAECHQRQEEEEVRDLRQLQDGQLRELRHLQGHEVFWWGRKNEASLQDA